MKNQNRKNNIPQIVRRVIQIIAFILLPGLFISTFGAIKDIVVALIGGSFSIAALSSQLLLLVAIIPATMLFGRFFCGFFCSFGSMGDFLWFISRKLFKRKVSISQRADKALKAVKYVLLAAIVILTWILGLVSLDSTASPWTIFGMYFTIGGWPSAAYLLSVGAALLLLIMIGSVFVERFFCRYLCPLGAVFSIISKPRLFHIKKPRDACSACTLCTSQCAMGIQLNETDSVSSGECINCLQCVNACPRRNVTVNPTPAVATSMAAAAMAGLYFVGNITVGSAASALDTVSAVEAAATGDYTDGIYTGSASGFRGTTTVQVTVENGEISDVTVVSTNDDSQYFNRAENSVISNILLSQSVDVPTVSGATFSSNAIINAVRNALESSNEAVTADETQQSESTAASSVDSNENTDTAVSVSAAPDTSVESNSTESASAAEGTYIDGVYTGTGSGFRGETTVEVTVSNGVISDITVVTYADDAPYFNRAESTVIASIISNQSINVSTVSGATFSSNSIIEAVANALSIDFTNPNSTLPKHNHSK